MVRDRKTSPKVQYSLLKSTKEKEQSKTLQLRYCEE